MGKRENIRYSQGGGSWQRITSSSVVVFEGGASPPSTPFLMPTHQGGNGQKKIRRRRHKRLTYLSPRDILYMLKGDKVFRLTFEDYLPLFTPPRSTGLVFPVSARFVNFPANVFSYNEFPLSPSAPFVKRQRHRRLTSAAFGDIIKLQNRRGGSLPKGR